MRLLPYLERVPRPALLLIAVPVAVFAVSFALRASFATSDDDDAPSATSAPAPPALNVTASEPELLPTPIPSTDPAVADRTDCAEIAGTDYRSPAERDWYLANCTQGGGGGASAVAGSVQTITGPPPATGGGQSPIGDRLVIPSIGVNADVWKATVGANGAMPNPSGYFNAVWYDFGAWPGLGGYVDGGNAVISGHVDCARCHNGSPGLAVFYYIRNLQAGDQIQYYTAAGAQVNYVVTASAAYAPTTDFSSIVASPAADLTLITCTGTFSGGEYNLRHVVFARRV